jgi:hypothetical protein
MQNYILWSACQTWNCWQLGLFILYFQWLITDRMPWKICYSNIVIQPALSCAAAVLYDTEHTCFLFMKNNTFWFTCFVGDAPSGKHLTVKVQNVVIVAGQENIHHALVLDWELFSGSMIVQLLNRLNVCPYSFLCQVLFLCTNCAFKLIFAGSDAPFFRPCKCPEILLLVRFLGTPIVL